MKYINSLIFLTLLLACNNTAKEQASDEKGNIVPNGLLLQTNAESFERTLYPLLKRKVLYMPLECFEAKLCLQ